MRGIGQPIERVSRLSGRMLVQPRCELSCIYMYVCATFLGVISGGNYVFNLRFAVASAQRLTLSNSTSINLSIFFTHTGTHRSTFTYVLVLALRVHFTVIVSSLCTLACGRSTLNNEKFQNVAAIKPQLARPHFSSQRPTARPLGHAICILYLAQDNGQL